MSAVADEITFQKCRFPMPFLSTGHSTNITNTTLII